MKKNKMNLLAKVAHDGRNSINILIYLMSETIAIRKDNQYGSNKE